MRQVKAYIDITTLLVNSAIADSVTTQTSLKNIKNDIYTGRTNVITAMNDVFTARGKLRDAASAFAILQSQLQDPNSKLLQQSVIKQAADKEELLRAATPFEPRALVALRFRP